MAKDVAPAGSLEAGRGPAGAAGGENIQESPTPVVPQPTPASQAVGDPLFNPVLAPEVLPGQGSAGTGMARRRRL